MADNELPLTGSPQPPTGGPTPSTAEAAIQERVDASVAAAFPQTVVPEPDFITRTRASGSVDSVINDLTGSPTPPPTAPPSTAEAPSAPTALVDVESNQSVVERSVDPTAPLAPETPQTTQTAVRRQLPGLPRQQAILNNLTGQNVAEAAEEAHQEAGTIVRRADTSATTGTHEEGYGTFPHRFQERSYQVMHHDARVYIQGYDVSNWLEGQITITNNVGTEPNSCDITLNNALDRFILTPDNFAGIWRLGGSTDGEVSDYDESIKHGIYQIKNPIGNNPIDDRSGGRMWPLEYYCSIFHAMDPIRVWIRNPMNVELDEWIPMFTGYVVNVGDTNDYIRHGSSITLGCKDIRHLMAKMRTNRNSVLWVQPGNELTENNTTASTVASGDRPTSTGGGAFSPDFFQDLVVINTTMSDPWSTMNLWQIIKFLTYSGGSTADILRVSRLAELEILQQDLNDAQLEYQSLQDNADNAQRRQVLAATIARLEARVRGDNSTTGTPPAQPNSNQRPANEVSSSVEAEQAAANANQSVAPNPQAPTPVAVGPNGLVPTRSSGKSKIGRMTKGKVYAYPSGAALDDIEDEATGVIDADTASQNTCLTNFTDIVMFGFTTRESSEDGIGDVTINQDTIPAYWTEAQVQEAGRWTRSNRSWAPDVQMVHVLKPKVTSAGAAVIRENQYIDGGAVNTQYNWMSRLDLLAEACEMTDYRFYVSGTGDLIFEFPMYDFYPSDFSVAESNGSYGWQQVYEFNTDLISDAYNPESGEIVNCVIVVGGITGYSQFAEAGSGDQSSTALSPGDQPHAIVYCPTLTGRHGVNVKTLSLPRIQNRGRLEQIATMNMQKWFGQANNYAMEVSYRPWFGLNRVSFNSFRNRYALAESVIHTIPVRESGGSPSTSLTLSYPRNLDQFGVPRFFTGGASMPIYFGSIPSRGEIRTIVQALEVHSREFRALLTAIQAQENGAGISQITHDQLIAYQLQNRAPFPQSSDFYNVVHALSIEYQNTTLDRAGGSTADLVRRAELIQSQILDLQTNTALSTNERAFRINQLERNLEEVMTAVNAIQATTDPESTDSPLFGRSGIRTPRDSTQPENGPGDTVIELCDLDGTRYSSPLGRKEGTNQFPRSITTSYSSGHPGVDYAAVLGESVYAVRDGAVTSITTNATYGNVVIIYHGDDYGYSAYASVSASVAVGASVRRNQVIGTVAQSPESITLGSPVLHFVLMSDQPTITANADTRAFFVPPTHYPLQRIFNGRTAQFNGQRVRNSFAQSRPRTVNGVTVDNARVHGGYDLTTEQNRPVLAPVTGTLYAVYKDHEQFGYGVGIRDSEGALHSLGHFSVPVSESLTGPLVGSGGTLHPSNPPRITGGTPVGLAGNTGNSTGIHLHYQISLQGLPFTRVDVGPRLAALYKGYTTIPQICTYEATHIVERQTGVWSQRAIAAGAPESPVEGKTIDQLWEDVSSRSSEYTPPAPIGTDMTYFNTAVGPTDPYGVPFRPNTSGITDSDALTFVMVGDNYGSRSSKLRTKLISSLKTKLNRTSLDIVSGSNSHSSIALWCETAQEASRRTRRSDRSMSLAALDEYSSQYKIILVSMVGVEYNAADMTPQRIQQMNAALEGEDGAYVFWIIHKALPLSARAVHARTGTANQTIQQLIANNISQQEADIHLASGNRIRAAGVRYIDVSNVNPIDITRISGHRGWTQNHDYDTAGAEITAPQIADDLVLQLRRIVTDGNNGQVLPTDVWAMAKPPEDCPPERQRILNTVGVAAPPIPGAPESLTVTADEVIANPPPATKAQRRLQRSYNSRLRRAADRDVAFGTTAPTVTNVLTPEEDAAAQARFEAQLARQPRPGPVTEVPTQTNPRTRTP